MKLLRVIATTMLLSLVALALPSTASAQEQTLTAAQREQWSDYVVAISSDSVPSELAIGDMPDRADPDPQDAPAPSTPATERSFDDSANDAAVQDDDTTATAVEDASDTEVKDSAEASSDEAGSTQAGTDSSAAEGSSDESGDDQSTSTGASPAEPEEPVAVPATVTKQTVTVQTVPPLPGIAMQLGDVIGETDEQGFVALEVTDTSNAGTRLQVLDNDVSYNDIGVRARFSRVFRRNVNTLVVGFDVEHPVNFAYTDTNGTPIDPEQLSGFTLKSTVGEVIEARLGEPVWLQGSRVVSSSRGPEQREVEWSIASLLADGSSVINRGQVRFFPTTQRDIPVEVLFFSAEFTAPDLLFGYNHDGAVELTYPSGLVERHDLVDGVVRLESLPRGEYSAVVVGSGPKLARPVQLSRNQAVDLALLSWFDLIALGIVGFFFLLIPLIVGRQWWRRRNVAGATT